MKLDNTIFCKVIRSLINVVDSSSLEQEALQVINIIEDLCRKQYGDEYARQYCSNVLPNVLVDELHLYKAQGKIAAIKAFRARTGLGLKESKDAIENAAAKLGMTISSISY
jgi:ribosomal protein L7/L12